MCVCVCLSQYGRMTSMDTADADFRKQEARKNMEHASDENGRPKYGRRRYPLSLFPADFDMLQV